METNTLDLDAQAKRIVETVPENQWPAWVRNRHRSWGVTEDQGVSQYPEEWLTNPDLYYESKLSQMSYTPTPEQWQEIITRYGPYAYHSSNANEAVEREGLRPPSETGNWNIGGERKYNPHVIYLSVPSGVNQLQRFADWKIDMRKLDPKNVRKDWDSPEDWDFQTMFDYTGTFSYVGSIPRESIEPVSRESKWKIADLDFSQFKRGDQVQLKRTLLLTGDNVLAEGTIGTIYDSYFDPVSKRQSVAVDFENTPFRVSVSEQDVEGINAPDAPPVGHPSEWTAKFSAGLGYPANYTPADPYDISGKMPLINAMEVPWWNYPPEQAKQIIINAFRATMLSPRMNLKSNAILYQSLMDIPAEESNPDVFENRVRELKTKWDTQGQIGIGQEAEDVADPNEILPGKFMPGFWGNIRRLANLGPYADDIYTAAMDDIAHGGSGQRFRQEVLNLGIPGVQAKVASFAWLTLAPNTSDLATLDVHMMRHLNQQEESPRNTNHYMELEEQLRNEKDETYGTEVPLSHYQWAVWDARRTPGYHQDHTPLRAHQPTPFTEIHWPATARPPRPQAPVLPPAGQLSLMGKWKKVPAWQLVRLGSNSYTIQGKIVAGVPNANAQGIAVRPDKQSRADIEQILQSLPTHAEDYQRQRELIPEWAPSMNRGGKTAAGFQLGPGGRGITYSPPVICVSEWVDVNDNWLLMHPACRGIVAEKGGAASHGVVVALQRNIAIVVDIPEAAAIEPGDHLQILSENAIIHVNGGTADEFGEAKEAELPIVRWVWSKGNYMTAPVPLDNPEGGTLHQHMMMQLFRDGKWDRKDSALGVIYEDGRVQMTGTPSDEGELIAWLGTVHPITNIEKDFSL